MYLELQMYTLPASPYKVNSHFDYSNCCTQEISGSEVAVERASGKPRMSRTRAVKASRSAAEKHRSDTQFTPSSSRTTGRTTKNALQTIGHSLLHRRMLQSIKLSSWSWAKNPKWFLVQFCHPANSQEIHNTHPNKTKHARTCTHHELLSFWLRF